MGLFSKKTELEKTGMEVDILLNTNKIKKLEQRMFSDSRLPKEELWLLGFAAPALVNDKYFSDDWIKMDEKKRDNERYSIASNQGIDKESDFLECVDEFITFGVSLYLDEMLTILKNKSPDEWGRAAKKILPINEKQVAKIKSLKTTMDTMDKFGLPFPQKTLRAFDFARAAEFCVLSYGLDAITIEKTYIKMKAIASEAMMYYSSWEEYVCAYTLAYDLKQWAIEDFFAIGCSGFYSEARVLLLSPKSLYQSINFFLDSKTLETYKQAEQIEPPKILPSLSKERQDFEMRMKKIPLKKNNCTDYVEPKKIEQMKRVVFSYPKIPIFEHWLLGFSAPVTAKDYMTVDYLGVYDEKLEKRIANGIKRSWEIMNRNDLLNTIENLIDDYSTPYYDEILSILKFPYKQWEELFIKTNHFSDKQIKKSEEIKKFADTLEYYGIELPKETLCAWNFGRAAALAVGGCGIGYLKREEALNILKRVAQKTNEFYFSWNDYTGSYYISRAIWLWTQNSFFDINSLTISRTARILLNSKESVFCKTTINEFLNYCD